MKKITVWSWYIQFILLFDLIPKGFDFDLDADSDLEFPATGAP